MHSAKNKVAVIDLGSNSARLSISDVSGDNIKTLYMEKSRVKLSENMNSDMMLKEPAVCRTLSVLKSFKTVISKFECDKVFAVATAAVRKAKNGDEFVKRVYNETNLDLKVISGEQEAKYDFLGVKASVECSDFIIMDIGGGSTEIIGAKGGRLYDFKSIPMGSRSITEKYLFDESDESIKKAEEVVFKEISDIKWLGDFLDVPIIGLGGCLKAVGKNGAAKKGEKLCDGYAVSVEDIKKLYADLKKLSVCEREKVEGMQSRGDIILGGLMPFLAVSKIVSSNKLLVSASGVRDGILFEYMNCKANVLL